MQHYFQHYWQDIGQMVKEVPYDSLIQAVKILLDCHQRESTIFIIGNGGSASTASHFACDLAKNTRIEGKKAFRAISLTDNNSSITAWANDTGFQHIFSEQLAPLMRHRDLLISLSTSGNSPNIVGATQLAKQIGAVSIALTGPSGGKLFSLADVTIKIPAVRIEQIEDAHLIVTHSLCVTLRQLLANSGDVIPMLNS